MDGILLTAICVLFYLAIKLFDSKSNKVQYYLKWWSYYSYSLFVSTVLCFIFVWRGRALRNFSKIMKWFQPLTKFHGMTWHLENAEVLNACGRAVIISNHQSTLDLLGQIHATSTIKYWMPIAIKDLLYMGSVGLLSYLLGTVFLDRRNATDSYRRLNKAAEIMIENEVKIWIFPEGIRNIQKKVKLLPFKKGAFTTAVAAQAPIIPIVYSPYYFVNEEKLIFKNGGHMIMRCLEPVPTTGLTIDDVPALTERLHNIVLNAYEELSKEVVDRFPGAVNNTAGKLL